MKIHEQTTKTAYEKGYERGLRGEGLCPKHNTCENDFECSEGWMEGIEYRMTEHKMKMINYRK